MLRFSVRRAVYSRPIDSANEFIEPVVKRSIAMKDPITTAGNTIGWALFAVTYGIMVNWIYEGYLDLWHGTYGLGDDDDDD